MDQEPEPDDLAAEWARVEAAWDDPQAHRRYVTVCGATGRLAYAGRRYRQVQASDPERRALAEAQIDRILALAMERLAVEKTPAQRPELRQRVRWLAFAVGLGLIGSAWILWLRSR